MRTLRPRDALSPPGVPSVGRRLLPAALRSRLREHLVEVLECLPLPGAHLVRVHLMARRDRLHRVVLPRASSATRFLNSAVKRRFFLVTPVSPLDTGVHPSEATSELASCPVC